MSKENVTLPYDYARCMVTDENKDCPLAHNCLRRLAPGREVYQSMTPFEGGEQCKGYIPYKV